MVRACVLCLVVTLGGCHVPLQVARQRAAREVARQQVDPSCPESRTRVSPGRWRFRLEVCGYFVIVRCPGTPTTCHLEE